METPLGLWRSACRPARHFVPGDALYCLVRAEHWQQAEPASPNTFQATVKRIEFHGDSLHVELGTAQLALSWRVPAHLLTQLHVGHTLQLSVPPEHLVLLRE
ncbi:hypothetical protein HRbin36_01193 [bacterium HR36]|nr:hypothetical protein HRbin36_01193 [bacterium HR36]